MSLQDELLADFASSDESEVEVLQPVEGLTVKLPIEEGLEAYLKKGREGTVGDLLAADRTNIESLFKLEPVLKPVLAQVADYALASLTPDREYPLLMHCNELAGEIAVLIEVAHSHVARVYSLVFPELETFIRHPVAFARVVLALGESLLNVENATTVALLKTFLSGEQMLVLTMAAIQQLKAGPASPLPKTLSEVCERLVALDEARSTLTQFVASRLGSYAPNLTALVGAQVAAQLMSGVGGLKALAATPSCNLASVGSHRQVGVGKGNVGVRQKGYLYLCDLVRLVSESVQKQAMRLLSGKLVLAARIDLSGTATGVTPSSHLGAQWRAEIESKLEKLAAPPENVGVKPLPIPVDAPSKKRGGRRLRKFKEQFALSELQKAANRMEFGHMETTVTDAYGRDIGLGMSARHESGSGKIRKVAASTKNQARMSKAMVERLR